MVVLSIYLYVSLSGLTRIYLSVCLRCKIRLLDQGVDQTIELARLLQSSGASMLTVHGRTREQRGRLSGAAGTLAFTRYSFTLRLLCMDQSSFYCLTPPAWPTLLQYYCMAIAQ